MLGRTFFDNSVQKDMFQTSEGHTVAHKYFNKLQTQYVDITCRPSMRDLEEAPRKPPLHLKYFSMKPP